MKLFGGGGGVFLLQLWRYYPVKDKFLLWNRLTSRVMMPNFREENYQSIGYFSVNNHWTPTLSIAENKLLELKNIVECLNDTNVPAVLNIQA